MKRELGEMSSISMSLPLSFPTAKPSSGSQINPSEKEKGKNLLT